MTSVERADLLSLRTDLFHRLDELDAKVDVIESRLDRWDGAITLVKAAASFVGLGGLSLFLWALVSTAH